MKEATKKATGQTYAAKIYDKSKLVDDHRRQSVCREVMLMQKLVHKYIVEFSQSVFVEEDASVRCKNYPSEDFDTFDDCDKEMMQSWVIDKYNFLPFFMAKEESNATAGPVEVDFNCHEVQAYAHYNGYIKSTCPRPCTQTQIKLNKLVTEKWSQTMVEVMFSDKVMVTYNYYPEFSLVEALASLGGSLGLWLGLGVLQLLQLLLATLVSLVDSLTNKKKSSPCTMQTIFWSERTSWTTLDLSAPLPVGAKNLITYI